MFAQLPRKHFVVPKPEHAWQRVHAHIMQTRRVQAEKPSLSAWKYLLLPRTYIRIGATVTVVILALTMIGGVASAQPGETLYTVKIAAEQVEKVLATNEEAKIKVGIRHARRRLQEVKTLVEGNKDGKVVAETLQALKTTTDELANGAVAVSETKPELTTKATELAVEQEKVLTSVESNAAPDLKEAVQDAIIVTKETITRLAEGKSEDVKGVATAPVLAEDSKPSATPTTTLKTTPASKPVASKKIKKDPLPAAEVDANASIGADVQIDEVVIIDDNNNPEPVE